MYLFSNDSGRRFCILCNKPQDQLQICIGCSKSLLVQHSYILCKTTRLARYHLNIAFHKQCSSPRIGTW